jgi:hypothetical protein
MRDPVIGAAAQVGGVRVARARGQDRWSGEPVGGEPMRETGGVRGPFLGPRIQ